MYVLIVKVVAETIVSERPSESAVVVKVPGSSK